MLPVRPVQENCANTGKEGRGHVQDPGEVPQSAERDRGAVKKCGSEARDKNRFLVTEVLQLSDWISSSPFSFFFVHCLRLCFLQRTTA